MNPGTKLGSYEILSQIGAGGMGEVYRARDTKLGRNISTGTIDQEARAQIDTASYFELRAKTARLIASAMAL